jgi:DNA-binding transcriptional ArsR family regulator
MSMPAVSKHLKVLERAGLIAQEREAQWRSCRLRAAPLKNVAEWVDEYRVMREEIAITRVFDAPRELVWEAWTNPKQVAQWWGPNGFTTPVCELDLRPGGAIRIDMRGHDGTVYPMTGIYRENVEPERLVLTSEALDKDGHPRI